MGLSGFVAGFQIAIFAFIGVELVGTTAAETKDIEKTLPKAINAIPIRVILFYIGALIVIMSVMPWRSIDPENSPFIVLFSFAGIAAAFTITYFVVITSAASSANSGIFSTSRMLFGLSVGHKAPKQFKKLSKAAVPANALIFSCMFLLPAVVLLYFDNQGILHAFTLVTTVSTILFVCVWSAILVAYIAFRRQRPELHEASKYKMPGGLFTCYMALAFFAFILVALWFREDTRIGLMYTPIWFILLFIAYKISPKHLRDKWAEEAKKHREEVESSHKH